MSCGNPPTGSHDRRCKATGDVNVSPHRAHCTLPGAIRAEGTMHPPHAEPRAHCFMAESTTSIHYMRGPGVWSPATAKTVTMHTWSKTRRWKNGRCQVTQRNTGA